MFRFKNLSIEKGLLHFVSARKDGNMSLMTADNREKILDNRIKLLGKHKIPIKNCLFARLDHGTNIFEVRDLARPAVADALITRTSGISLALSAGDCVPIIFWDKKRKVLAVSHNGWRGTLAGLTPKVIRKMKNDFDCDVNDILVGIGPCICQNHYEVRSDVFSKIPEKYKKFAKVKPKEHWLFNLPAYNKQQMLDEGIHARNIEDCKICTFEDNNYFSSRRGDSGRFVVGGMINGR